MITRAVEPSRLRRGRMATSPVWYVERDGKRVRFHRKRDAVAFDADGCSHADTVCGWCRACHGSIEAA